MFRKNKLAMLVSEFLGTGLLTLVILSVKNSQLGLPFFIASAAGLIMLLLTLSLAGISGAIFNPAITFALWTVRKIKPLQALVYIIVQVLGGVVAWLLFEYLTKVSGIHNNDHFTARLLVAEVLGTFIFAFVWAAAVYQRFSLYAKAIAIGGGFMAGMLAASLVTGGGALNPAIALGTKAFGYATAFGPLAGAILGFNLYNLLFVETELAEVAQSRSEKSKTSKVNATLTDSLVASDVDGRNVAASSKAKTTVVRKNVAKKTKKAPVKKTTTKSKTTRGRNPNAV